MSLNRKIKYLIFFISLILIFSFSVSCRKTDETTEEVKRDLEEAELISNEKSEDEITISDEKAVEVKKTPTLKIVSVVGVDNDNNIFDLVNNTINGNINLIVVTFDTENFNISEDKIETVWELKNQEIYRSTEVINNADDTYKVGVSMSEGFFYTGEYKCNIYLNNSIEDYIEFEVSQVDFEPIEISGSGTTSSDFFDIVGGLTIFEFNNSGSGNFISYLLDEEGDELELLVNEIGSVNGKKAMYLPGGKYFINVEHGANWTFNITQPRSFDVKEIPYTFNGSSPDISDLILIDGLVEINYNYSGSGNFVVYLLNEYGDQLELLVNEIDTTSGSTTFKGDGSKYFVSVELADGNYNFNIDYK